MQYYTPQWLRPIVNPLLYIIFDKKFINLDTEYFKSVVMDLAGLWTFQVFLLIYVDVYCFSLMS